MVASAKPEAGTSKRSTTQHNRIGDEKPRCHHHRRRVRNLHHRDGRRPDSSTRSTVQPRQIVDCDSKPRTQACRTSKGMDPGRSNSFSCSRGRVGFTARAGCSIFGGAFLCGGTNFNQRKEFHFEPGPNSRSCKKIFSNSALGQRNHLFYQKFASKRSSRDAQQAFAKTSR